MASIRGRKFLFFTLAVIQLALIFTYARYVAVPHQIKLIESAQGVIAPLQSADYNAENIDAGKSFLQDVAPVYESYQRMVKIFYSFFGWTLFFFLIPGGLLWSGSHLLLQTGTNIKESIRNLVRFWLKYCMISLGAILIFITLLLIFLKSNFLSLEDPAAAMTSIKTLVIAALILYFFCAAAFAFINIPSWKTFVLSVRNIFFRRFSGVLFVAVINVSLISLNLFGIYKSLSYQPWFILALPLSLLLTITITFTRIFWIASLQQLQKNILR